MRTTQIIAPYAFGIDHPGSINGLNSFSSLSDLDHDVVVERGICTGSVLYSRLGFLESFTKAIDGTWTVGSGNGGLDTGTVAADSLYGLYVIGGRGANFVSDLLFSLGLSSPTVLPSGYTDYRRIGYVLTDSSANVRSYFQVDDIFFLGAAVLDIQDTTPTAGVWTTASVSAPPRTTANLVGLVETSNQRFGGLFTTVPPLAPGGTSNRDAVVYMETSGNQMRAVAVRFQQLVDANRQIAYTGSATGGNITLIEISTRGWVDRRGKDDL